MISDEKCKLINGPLLGHFGPKRAILATLVTDFFLGTSKFEIYMKKWSRIRREMVVLGGCVGDLSADCSISVSRFIIS